MSQHLSEIITPHSEPTPIVRPVLEPGDNLTRHEFERRYLARPDIKKAELIEGVVYTPSPVHAKRHREPHASIVTWLGLYQALTFGVQLLDNATVRLDLDNEPQPDALLRIEPSVGGRSHISEDDYIEGVPELIVEIAASSVSYDLHDKLHAYRRNSVQEYIVWRVDDKQIDWFQLVEGNYVRMEPSESHVTQSQGFPGLRLAVQALLDGDLAKVLAEQQKGFGTTEHTTFIERLRGK